MFQQARRRLTVLYIVLFALVLVVFSVVFYVGFVTVLQPDFDVAPELSNSQAAELAYEATIERIALALAIADLAAIAVVGATAWMLAARTLEPIREAHQRQQRFIADASHEIRNPLAATKSAAQAALKPEATSKELRAALQSVVESTDRLTRLANDLLTLARSSSVLSDERDRCDLSVVVAEAVEAYLSSEPSRPAVRATFAPDLPVAAGRQGVLFVRTQGCCEYPVGVSLQRLQAMTAGKVPYLECFVRAAREGHLSIVAQADRGYPFGMSLQGPQALAGR